MDFKIFLSAHRDWFRTPWPYSAEANVRRAALFCCASHRIGVENGCQLQMINFTWPTLHPICMCWSRKGFFGGADACTVAGDVLQQASPAPSAGHEYWIISIKQKVWPQIAARFQLHLYYMSASVSLNVEAGEAGATPLSTTSQAAAFEAAVLAKLRIFSFSLTALMRCCLDRAKFMQ